MILIRPRHGIEQLAPESDVLKLLERFGRTCYKSEAKITDESAPIFIRKILDSHHYSVIEHMVMSVHFVVDRGVSHELVRHRIASYSQESTRYCNYTHDHVTFILPPWVSLEEGTYGSSWNFTKQEQAATATWFEIMLRAEIAYNELIARKWSPQQARSILPNSLKTEIVMTANFREWREVFRQRTAQAAHPQMREVMIPLLQQLKTTHPVLFGDL